MHKTTLKEMAKELGMSVNTISRALRDMPDISDKTKRVVKEAAERMNYHPNLAASMLRTNRSKAIGVIVSDISNPVFSGMVKGIEFSCKADGYSMLLSNTSESYDEEVAALSSILKRNVDGVILFPTMANDGTVLDLLSKNIPFVLVGRKFSRISTNVVINDDMHGGFIAAEHLYKKGHRKFLYIAGPLYMSSSFERLEGFRQCLSYYGLPGDAVEVHETDASWEGGYVMMKKLLENGIRATAVFAFSDFMAIGIMKALRDYGIRVPEDLAVMGYDDIDFCELTVPRLTTIDLSKFRLGKRAMELLVQKINADPTHDNEHQQIIMEPKLVVREST